MPEPREPLSEDDIRSICGREMCYNVSGPEGCVTTPPALTTTFLYERIDMADDSLPQTREAAKAAGATHFFTNIPCNNGHLAPRYANDGKCTACVSFRSKRYCDANRDAVRATRMAWKNANRPQIAAYMAGYNAANAERVSEAKKACYRNRIDHYKALNRARYHANKTRSIEYNRIWAAENPERSKEIKGRWAQANKHYYAMRQSAHRLLMRNCTPAWLTSATRAIMRDFYREAERLTAETGVRHEVDHIIPLRGAYVCGLHVPWNLQILTRTANRAKGNKHGD